MFHLSATARDQFEASQQLLIPEDDTFWQEQFEYANEMGFDLLQRQRQELADMKPELLKIVPARFHPYIEDESIYLPNFPEGIAMDYRKWQLEQEQQFLEILARAHDNTDKTLPFIEAKAQEIYRKTLHDSRIVQIIHEAPNLTLFLNCTSGFIPESVVALHFKNVSSITGKLQLDSYYVYDELCKTDNGIALKIVFGARGHEVIIEAETIDAMSYFHPMVFHETQEWNGLQWLEQLSDDMKCYWLSEDGMESIIQKVTSQGLLQTATKVIDVNHLSKSAILESFHVDTFENPFAHFSEPIADDDLIDAALYGDMDRKIRAWNTLYENPQKHRAIINKLLLYMAQQVQEDALLTVYVNHFHTLGVLNEDVQQQLSSYLK